MNGNRGNTTTTNTERRTAIYIVMLMMIACTLRKLNFLGSTVLWYINAWNGSEYQNIK